MKGRVLVIGRGEAGRSVADLLKSHVRLSAAAIRRLSQQHRIHLDGRPCTPKTRVRVGQRLAVVIPALRFAPARHKRTRNASATRPVDDRGIGIRHVDGDIVVVDKPAGVTTVRHKEELAEAGARRRYLPPTLVDVLPRLLEARNPRPTRVRAVHRLDRDTSGLVVLARTAKAESHLGRQFRAHSIERRYLAIVRGRAKDERIESWLVLDRGDGRRGSSGVAGVGQRAVTHVRVLEDLGDFSLVECRLETGRTHQVRIHLGEHGLPLCGERVYDRPPHGAPLPDPSGCVRPALHAASLTFTHPTTNERMTFGSPLPKDMRDLLKRLRDKP